MNRILLLTVISGALVGCGDPSRKPATAPAASAPPPFLEGAASRGIDFQHLTGKGETMDIVQTSSGGCGLLDYDQDGWLDLYLVQGKHLNKPGGGNRLYRNLGNGAFEDVTEKAGVRGEGYGIGCATGDFDSDGWPDLFVANHGRNELYRNRGNGSFEAVGERVGAAISGFCVGAVFADFTGDGWPDLYTARYVRLPPDHPRFCPQNGVPASCSPTVYDPEPGRLLRNESGRRFVDITSAAGLKHDGRGMAAAAADLNADGRLDLLVTNDTTANSLFLSRGPVKFENQALMSGIAYGEMGVAEANMGCDFGDYNGDGALDLLIGVMQDRTTLLYRNDGAGSFSLASNEAGLGAATSSVVTFGCGFLDADNDGDLDFFQANGHVQDRIQEIDARLRFAQPRQLFENLGDGRFGDLTPSAGPALNAPTAGRGAAFGDIDNDGDVDVLVNNLDGPPSLLINQAERLGRHWLRVRLEGKAPNRTPEGALVSLQVGDRNLVRSLHTAYSYASANDPRVHFGLGEATQAGPLSIRWPNGVSQEVTVSGVDREIIVRQP
ncbi:MAG: CRTAC1 family protein [Actinomycetota bacterium]